MATINYDALDDRQTYREEKARVALTLRYLFLKVLIYRPALAKALDSHQSCDRDLPSSSWYRLQTNFIDECAQASQQIISMLYSISITYPQAKNFFGPWWHSMYYSKYKPSPLPIFGLRALSVASTASLVIVGRFLASSLSLIPNASAPDHVTDAAYLTQASELVKSLKGNPLILQKCHGYITKLRDMVETQCKHSHLSITHARLTFFYSRTRRTRS